MLAELERLQRQREVLVDLIETTRRRLKDLK